MYLGGANQPHWGELTNSIEDEEAVASSRFDRTIMIILHAIKHFIIGRV